MRVFAVLAAAALVFVGGLTLCFTQPEVVVREVSCFAMAEFVDALPSAIPEAAASLEPEQFCAVPFKKGFVSEMSGGVVMVGVTADGLALESSVSVPVPIIYTVAATCRSGDIVLVELNRLDPLIVLIFLFLAIVVGTLAAAVLN